MPSMVKPRLSGLIPARWSIICTDTVMTVSVMSVLDAGATPTTNGGSRSTHTPKLVWVEM